MYPKLLPYLSVVAGINHRIESELGVEINRWNSNALSSQVSFAVPKIFKPVAYYCQKRFSQALALLFRDNRYPVDSTGGLFALIIEPGRRCPDYIFLSVTEKTLTLAK